MKTIFCQIAAYRDPELVPTLRDLFAKAKHPERLRVAICWQKSPEESLFEFANHPQIKIDPVLSTESRGCCWSRARVQSLYDGEDYTLQLDSHHRFVQNWDTTMLEMLALCPSEKPLLTGYIGSYDAEKGLHPCDPWKMKAKPFAKDGTLLCVPIKIPDFNSLTRPVPARFLSAHFIFTQGSWCREVPYDPNLFFHGEEPSLSARSYTHGYDLFHPHKIVAYHQYGREGRPKFWDDHVALKAKLDAISKTRVRVLFGMEDSPIDFGPYGFGTVRTLADYEAYAGIDFRNRRLHRETLDGTDPPCSMTDDWSKSYSVLLHWSSKDIELPEGTTYVHYFIDDANGVGMWDHKATEAEDFQCPLRADFDSCREPAYLIVWPHTAKGPGPKKYSLALTPQTVYSPA